MFRLGRLRSDGDSRCDVESVTTTVTVPVPGAASSSAIDVGRHLPPWDAWHLRRRRRSGDRDGGREVAGQELEGDLREPVRLGALPLEMP